MRAKALGVALVAVLLVGSTQAKAAPRLALFSDQPVVVAGSGFRPYEKVRLLITPGPSKRDVRAGRRGLFRVLLRASMPRCGAFAVQAFGSRGSRAMIDRTGLDCASVD